MPNRTDRYMNTFNNTQNVFCCSSCYSMFHQDCISQDTSRHCYCWWLLWELWDLFCSNLVINQSVGHAEFLSLSNVHRTSNTHHNNLHVWTQWQFGSHHWNKDIRSEGGSCFVSQWIKTVKIHFTEQVSACQSEEVKVSGGETYLSHRKRHWRVTRRKIPGKSETPHMWTPQTVNIKSS